MSKTVNVDKVKIVIFNKTVFARVFSKAKVTWKTEKSGKIMQRNSKGHFCAAKDFVYAGR